MVKLNLWFPTSCIQSAALRQCWYLCLCVQGGPVFVRLVRSCQQKHRDALMVQYRQKCCWCAVAAAVEGKTKKQTANRLQPLSCEKSWPPHRPGGRFKESLPLPALLIPPHSWRCGPWTVCLRVFANFISKIVLVPKYPLAQLRVLLYQQANAGRGRSSWRSCSTLGTGLCYW